MDRRQIGPTDSADGAPKLVLPADSRRVGVVGVGRWGGNLARNFHRLGSLAAVCDTDPDCLRRAADIYPGVPPHMTPESLIRSVDLDALAIATPASTHYRIAALALEAGLHVFVEKPMTTDLSSARSLAGQARRAKRQLMTGHLLHYHPAFQALQRLVRTGRLGAVRRIVSHRLAPGPATPREHVLWEFAPHDVSMILACTGALPEWVFCSAPEAAAGVSPDAHCRITFGFSAGPCVETTLSGCARTKVQRFEVRGRLASAVFDDVLPTASKLRLVSTGQPDEAIPVTDREPLLAECAAFLETITTGTTPPSGAAEGLQVMAVLDACHRSLDTGQRAVPSLSDTAG